MISFIYIIYVETRHHYVVVTCLELTMSTRSASSFSSAGIKDKYHYAWCTFSNIYFYFMCTEVLPACISVRGCHISWNWSQRKF